MDHFRDARDEGNQNKSPGPGAQSHAYFDFNDVPALSDDYRATHEPFRRYSAREITRALKRGEWRNGEGSACCPAHEDKTPSLSISDGRNGWPVLFCHAGCSQDEVLDALRRLGLWPESRDGYVESARPKPKQEPKPDKHPTAYARRIWRQARPIAGTAAERYLREHRGIAGPLPERLRYAPSVWHAEAKRHLPALIVPAFDDAGELTRIQAVFLDPVTGAKAAVPNPKRHGKKTFGRGASHVPAVFPGAPGGRFDVVLTEGPEDAIAIRSTWPSGDVAASLGVGSLHKPAFAAGARFLIVADNDQAGARAAEKAAAEHALRGCEVSIATPPDGIKDSNQLLQVHGPAAVLAMLDAAKRFEPTAEAIAEGLNAREAAERTYATAVRFFDYAPTWEPHMPGPLDFNHSNLPPVHGLRATLGTGKTQAILQRIINPALANRHINVYVPAHKLSRELLERFTALAGPGSPRARIVLGRDQVLPSGEPVCRKVDLARKLTAAGKSVQTHLCARQRDDGEIEYCPHFQTCEYQKQLADKEPGVRFMAHAHMFTEHHKPDIAVIDESFWRTALRGCDRRGVYIPLWRLKETRDVPRRDGLGRDHGATADLAAITARCVKAIEAGGRLADYIAAGVTEDDARAAMVLEYYRVEHLDVTPGMPEALQKSRIDAYQSQEALKIARYFRLLAQSIAAGVDPIFAELRDAKNSDGAPEPRLYLYWTADLKIGNVPVLLADASLEPAIARRFFPQMEEPTVIDAMFNHYRAVQITDRRVAKSMLVSEPAGDNDPEWRHEENRRRANRRGELRRLIEVEASRGATLCVSYKAAVEAIQAEGEIPNASFANWNNLRGRDEWRDIDTLIIAGVPQPNEAAIERMARALFHLDGEPIKLAGGQYKCAVRAIHLADGGSQPVAVDVHVDQRCTMLLDQIRAELLQALGRARLIHRQADKPCKIILLTNHPLPLAVHELSTWDEMMPDPLAVLMTRGVMPEAWRDAATVLADMIEAGGTRAGEAAAIAFKRAGVPTPGQLIDARLSNKPLLYKNHRGLLETQPFRYRLAGQRQSARILVDTQRHRDPRAAVEAALGPLDRFEPLDEPPRDPPPPPVDDIEESSDLVAAEAAQPAPPAELITRDWLIGPGRAYSSWPPEPAPADVAPADDDPWLGWPGPDPAVMRQRIAEGLPALPDEPLPPAATPHLDQVGIWMAHGSEGLRRALAGELVDVPPLPAPARVPEPPPPWWRPPKLPEVRLSPMAPQWARKALAEWVERARAMPP